MKAHIPYSRPHHRAALSSSCHSPALGRAIQKEGPRDPAHDLPWRRVVAWWVGRGYPTDLLLRGDSLESVERWVASHPDDLADEERDFLEASRRASHAALRKRRLSGALSCLVAILATGSMLMLYFWAQARGEAQRQSTARSRAESTLGGAIAARATAEAKIAVKEEALQGAQLDSVAAAEALRKANARVLAASSTEALDRDRDLAILLAVQAIRLLGPQRAWSDAASSATGALYRSLGHVGWENPVRDAGVPVDASHYVAWPSRDGRLVSVGDGNTAAIWDPSTGLRLHTLTGHGEQVRRAIWSPDGSRVVTVAGDGIAMVWDAGTGARLCTMGESTNEIRSASWAPDGSRIATASWHGFIVLWDAITGVALVTLDGRTGWPETVSWSADGSLVVSVVMDGTVGIWDSESGALSRLLKLGGMRAIAARMGNGDSVEVLSDADNGNLISECERSLWDARTGTRLLDSRPADETRDERVFMAILTRDDESMFFERSEDLVAYACSRVGRNLTLSEWERVMGPDTPYRKTCGGLPAGR